MVFWVMALVDKTVYMQKKKKRFKSQDVKLGFYLQILKLKLEDGFVGFRDNNLYDR